MKYFIRGVVYFFESHDLVGMNRIRHHRLVTPLALILILKIFHNKPRKRTTLRELSSRPMSHLQDKVMSGSNTHKRKEWQSMANTSVPHSLVPYFLHDGHTLVDIHHSRSKMTRNVVEGLLRSILYHTRVEITNVNNPNAWLPLYLDLKGEYLLAEISHCRRHPKIGTSRRRKSGRSYV